MDTKVLLLLVLCITITSIQGAIPRCCIKTSPISIHKMKKASMYKIQNRMGACEIEAVVIYVNQKKYCAPMKVKPLLEKIQRIKQSGSL